MDKLAVDLPANPSAAPEVFKKNIVSNHKPVQRLVDLLYQKTSHLLNQPAFADINKTYAEAMHYQQADRLSINLLWLHFIFLVLLVTLNTYLRIPQIIPSPFGWDIISPQEGIAMLVIGLATVLLPTITHSRLSNHYLWRLLVTVSLLSYSYLFIYVSGGAIEMRYHFLLVMIFMALYADWRIGWYIFSIIAFQHLIVDTLWPGGLYFYGPNSLSPLLNITFFLVATIFTTVICRNYRSSVEALTLAKQRNDQFIAIASHELKTPLTSIRGYTEVIMRKMKRNHDPSLSHMVKIDDQLTKVINMIRDLLDISTRHSGQVELNIEPLSIETVIRQAVEEAQAVAHKHTIEIQGNLRVMIEGDRIRLGQLMSNLITNAIKYSPQADRIIIKVASARDRIIVSVQDFGIGITQADKVKIFEPYFRGTGAKRSDVPGGLGMGLFISDEIVRRHGGRMWVDSQLGYGSTFSFLLPLPRVPVVRQSAQAVSLKEATS